MKPHFYYTKMKKIVKFLKYILLILIITYLFSFILYQTNFVHWGLQKFCFRSQIGCMIEEKIHSLMTPFNFYKVTLKNSIPKEKYIDLKISPDELKYIQEKIKYFLELGFIEDSSNEWRNASTLIDGEYEEIKYKFHGTSTTPLKNSRSKFWQLYKKFNIEEDIDLNKVHFSLKIKHKKKSKYRNNIRSYNIITTGDSASINVIAMNSIAKSMGLLAQEVEYNILRINGLEMGLFLFSEDFKKEWFEREHNITNYSIIKSIDDWDSREPGHISDLDLTIEYKEIKTIGPENNVALAKMELLFEAIKSENSEDIKKLINIEDMAKYLALYALFNNNHPLTGDNLKYIYNLSTGKFRLIFRVEDSVRLMKGPISKFNYDLFNSVYPEEWDLLSHKLFRVLLRDSSFRLKRDQQLLKIINNWDKMIIEVTEKVFLENEKIILKQDNRAKSTLYKLERLKEVLNFHKNLTKNYLEYNKVYITRRIGNNSNYFTIYNDSFSSTYLKSIKIKNAEGIIFDKNIEKFFPPLVLNSSMLPVKKKYKIEVGLKEDDQVISFHFINQLTGKKIDKKHIYYNKSSYKSIINYSYNNKNLFIKDDLSKTLKVKSGSYIITENIITPFGYKVLLEPGVKIKLAPDVSILIRGPLFAEGQEDNKIIVSNLEKNKPFGTFSIYPINKNSKVKLSHFEVNGGNEALIDGIYFSGQISIHSANVFINYSSFLNSQSDDGINIKYSDVEIKNSIFMNNKGDQIDLDYCNGVFINNNLIFEKNEISNNLETDGLDISGTDIDIKDNIFDNFSDKGISVGEKSYPFISMNIFNNNNLALAIKDSSIAKIENNTFNNNKIDISLYIKKKLYTTPKLILDKGNTNLNIKNVKGEIIYH